MAHATRHEICDPSRETAPRAKALPPAIAAPVPEVAPDKRPTWRPPRRSNAQESGERPCREGDD
jgi:hypothetical protein